MTTTFRKRAIIVALAALIAAGLAAYPAAAQTAPKSAAREPRQATPARGLALGIFLGQPTGLTCRYGLGAADSVEGKAAWNFGNAQSASFTFQANWLHEIPGLLVIQGEDFPPYVGAGVQVDAGAGTSVSFRIPAGIVYRFAQAPIELCLEVGLGLQLFPSTRAAGSGGLGVRYRFQ
jgi:hypothetical protein